LRRKRKKEAVARGSGKLFSWAWPSVSLVALSALIIAVAAAFAINFYQKFNSTGAYRMDYEGRIFDKSLTLSESLTGTGAVRRLHIQAKNGESFAVVVNSSLYERAQIGMWIKSDRNGAQLSWPGQAPANSEIKREGAEHPLMSAPK
jgi:hypothetical protein